MKLLTVRIHLWLGLAFGLLWSVQGLTGALLVFHRELDRPAGALVSRSAKSLDILIAAASRSKRAQPESIGLYYPDPALLGVTFADPAGGKLTVLVDSTTAEVIADRRRTPSTPANGNGWRWIYNLHHGLLLGERGEWFLGASGLVLLTMAFSGIYLGWPRRRQWRAAFAAMRWRTRLQQLFGWHRAVGLLAASALLLLSVSGALIDFGKPLRAWAEVYAGYRPPFKLAPAPVPDRLISAQQALERASAYFPGAKFVSLTMPTDKTPAYQIRMLLPGEWRSWSGTSLATIDPVSGSILDTYDASRAPLTNRILESAFAVHSGEVAGLVGRLLTFIAGLSLPLLYVTGIWAWLRKRGIWRRFPLRSDRRPIALADENLFAGANDGAATQQVGDILAPRSTSA